VLKRRIIPVELLRQGRLVKTVKFNEFRDVGDPLKSSQVYNDQDADELILLNIDRNKQDVSDTVSHLGMISKKCFMPIAVGGGIKTIEDAKSLFDAGADKVIINTAAHSDRGLLSSISNRWGSQSLIISIDVLKISDEAYCIKSECGTKEEPVSLIDFVNSLVNIGVGELMINSINNDGVMKGYDLSLIRSVISISNIPIIACGGAGSFIHLVEAFDLGVSAVACGSLFNFGDNNPLRAKAFLKNYGIPLKRI